MTIGDQSKTVRAWATDEEYENARDQYALAVGRVSAAWVYLHERLCALFSSVAEGEKAVFSAVWYSTENDRSQRNMLLLAAKASKKISSMPNVLAAIQWLLTKCESASDRRNDAIHMPVAVWLGMGENGAPIVGPSYILGHPRAKKFLGNKLLAEFTACEEVADELSLFTMKLTNSINSGGAYPLPDKPQLPSLALKK